MSRLAAALPLLFALACSPDKSDADASTTDAGETTAELTSVGEETITPTDPGAGARCDPQPEATSDCCCFTKDDADSVFIANTCAAAPICPSARILCSQEDSECPVPQAYDGPPEAFTADDEDALTCILTALRDGTPGTLEWSFADSFTDGQYRREVVQHVIAGRRVFVTAVDTADQAGAIHDVTLQPLRPPEFFADCLLADLRTRALCLAPTTTAEVLETCAVGGPYSEF